MDTLQAYFHMLQVLLPAPLMHPDYLSGMWMYKWLVAEGAYRGMEAALPTLILGESIVLPIVANWAVPFVNRGIGVAGYPPLFESYHTINPFGYIFFWHIIWFMVLYNVLLAPRHGVTVSLYDACLYHAVSPDVPPNYRAAVREARILWALLMCVPTLNVVLAWSITAEWLPKSAML